MLILQELSPIPWGSCRPVPAGCCCWQCGQCWDLQERLAGHGQQLSFLPREELRQILPCPLVSAGQWFWRPSLPWAVHGAASPVLGLVNPLTGVRPWGEGG